MKKLKYLFGIFIIITAIVAVFLLAGRFGSGESVESEKPAVVCKKEECFWTAHIHATLKVYRGNEPVELNFEQGKLEEEHTHAQKDKLHWHGLIPVDSQSREVKDWSTLKVSKIPQDLGLEIGGETRFVVNNKEVGPDYIWEDGDEIQINF